MKVNTVITDYEHTHFVDSTKPVWNYSLFSDDDISNFQNGTHYRLYEIFGSHAREVLDTKGYYFAVWAPNATAVSVIGNFNDWKPDEHPLFVRLEKSVSGKDLFRISTEVKYINIISVDSMDQKQ